MKDPWIKFYANDFLNGVSDLSAEQIGAYIVVLALMWDRGGPIQDDPRRIARRCGLTTRKWTIIREFLIQDGKLEARDGMIANPRALNDLRARATKSEKARQSALARWDQPDLPLGENENYLDENLKKTRKKREDNRIDKIDEKSRKGAENLDSDDANAFSPSRARAFQKPEARIIPYHSESMTRAEALELICRTAGHDPRGDEHQAKAAGYLDRWLEAGANLPLILDVIERMLAEQPDKITGSLARFDKHILAKVASLKATENRKKPSETEPVPLFVIPDEPPECEAIRHELADTMGHRNYAITFNLLRFTADVTRHDEPVLKITGPPVTLRAISDQFPTIRSIAKRHGFPQVW